MNKKRFKTYLTKLILIFFYQLKFNKSPFFNLKSRKILKNFIEKRNLKLRSVIN